MKKSLFTLLLSIVFITAACGNQAVNEGEPAEKVPKTVEEEQKNEGDVTETEVDENEESKNKNQTEEESVKENADEVLKLLEAKNSVELSNYVHQEKGVLFSPYVYIDKETITFDKEKVKDFFADTETYTWGNADGSGEPIELTPSDYYTKFIYDSTYDDADTIEFDRTEARGNTIRNIQEVFPDAHTVEYYVKGTEENANMDWKALNLVFEQDEQGEWKLVAIVHDQWTI